MNRKGGELPAITISNGSLKENGKASLSPMSSYQSGDRRLSTISVDSTLGDKQLFSGQEEQLTGCQRYLKIFFSLFFFSFSFLLYKPKFINYVNICFIRISLLFFFSLSLFRYMYRQSTKYILNVMGSQMILRNKKTPSRI